MGLQQRRRTAIVSLAKLRLCDSMNLAVARARTGASATAKWAAEAAAEDSSSSMAGLTRVGGAAVQMHQLDASGLGSSALSMAAARSQAGRATMG